MIGYLAFGPSPPVPAVLREYLRLGLPPEERPAMLVSYVYRSGFLRMMHEAGIRFWCMDSGAFTAHASGVDIPVDVYTQEVQRLRKGTPPVTEVFALDVIGDYRASRKNAEYMHENGVAAIPTFHYGSPRSELLSLVREYDKIAFGGAVGVPHKRKLLWAQRAMDAIWPHRVHGFGFHSEEILMRVPFHSADASSWESAPLRYGNWAAFGNKSLSIRGSAQNLRAQVEHYMSIERRVTERWRSLFEAAGIDATSPHTVKRTREVAQ